MPQARDHGARVFFLALAISGCTSSEAPVSPFDSPPFVAPLPGPPPNGEYVVHFPRFIGTGWGMAAPSSAPSPPSAEHRACTESEEPYVSIGGGRGTVVPRALVWNLLWARVNACLPLEDCWSGVDFVVILDVDESGRVSLSSVESTESFPGVTECLHKIYDGVDIHERPPNAFGPETLPTAPGSIEVRASLGIRPKLDPSEKRAPRS